MSKFYKFSIQIIAIFIFIGGIYGSYYRTIQNTEESMTRKDREIKANFNVRLKTLKKDLKAKIDKVENRSSQKIEKHVNSIMPMLNKILDRVIKQGNSISKIQGKLEGR